MMYFLSVLLILNLGATAYFIAALHKRAIFNARNIKAINMRLGILEDKSQALQMAYDFRIKVVENRVFDIEDTGFNVYTLRRTD